TPRGVAQPGSALGSGPSGRRFKSSRPDQSFSDAAILGFDRQAEGLLSDRTIRVRTHRVLSSVVSRLGGLMRLRWIRTLVLSAGLLIAALGLFAQPREYSAEDLAKATVHRRAVDAIIWGQPIVSFDAMRQAYFRDGKAKYNDIIWWPRNSGWKNQSLTVKTGVRYI